MRHTAEVPELPEVETIRRQLDPVLRDAVVVDAWAFPSGKFHDAPLAIGARLDGVRRRGKYLLIDLAPTRDGDVPRELVVHLGMTGRLAVDAIAPAWPARLDGTEDGRGDGGEGEADATAPDAPTHLRAWWRLDDGRTLWFDDVRRFGRIAVVDRGAHDALPTLAALGPEPFDEAFTPELLRTRVNASRRAVKTQLLSQRVVAGVGNIYADEALWRTRLHYERPTASLTRPRTAELVTHIREVMNEALAQGGTSFDSLYVNVNGESGYFDRSLDAYGREDEPCRRCGTPIRRRPWMNRSSYYCPRCQRPPAAGS